MPSHYVRASGCRIWTADGRELIDCTMALGAVALGYAEAAVTMAVTHAAERGNVAGMSHVLEVEVAERLSDVIPCAERVRFLKSGAEGVSAAVRIARAHTKRARVIGCGYFGWLDWWTDGPGITSGAHADFAAVPFDDITALESAAAEAGADLAAIVIEPVIERLPSNAWIEAARAICDERGAVLVFDEMKTGFRLRTGGFQEYSGDHARSRGVRQGDGERLSVERDRGARGGDARGRGVLDFVDAGGGNVGAGGGERGTRLAREG